MTEGTKCKNKTQTNQKKTKTNLSELLCYVLIKYYRGFYLVIKILDYIFKVIFLDWSICYDLQNQYNYIMYY